MSCCPGFLSAVPTDIFGSIAGYSYHRYYKHLVLQKMDNAFQPGDPALEVAGVADDEHWAIRDEQDKIDQIISGQASGHYYLLIGEKGTGKTSMLLNAMRKNNGSGVSMLDAHGDLEIFRLRLGKALDYEFHEEYVLCFRNGPDTEEYDCSQEHSVTLVASSAFGAPETQRLSWILSARSTSWKSLR